MWLGWNHTLFKEGVFFSKAAVVTFGGAYAVLPYVTQQALSHYGWLKPGQMMDGLGLAETTPGPLIMVLQFVGFMGGWQHPQGLSPLLAATLGALHHHLGHVHIPCFLWIFLGGPYIEQLRGNVKLTTALSAITAAVVGVVLNLAVWFGMHALFPDGAAVDWFAVIVSLVAFPRDVALALGHHPGRARRRRARLDLPARAGLDSLGPTRKLKLPLVTWRSWATALQVTL